jgi:hypothetical protein
MGLFCLLHAYCVAIITALNFYSPRYKNNFEKSSKSVFALTIAK